MPNDNILTWPLGSIDFSDGCVVMGILNVTPDSFSDGGRYNDAVRAVERGVRMIGEGAAIIDIGPESTRPGAQRVSVVEQIARAIPVIESLAVETSVPVSIDTRDYLVAEAAVRAGAAIINDISGFDDDRMCDLAAQSGAVAVIMHMQGTPDTMQKTPEYTDVVEEVLAFLIERAKKLAVKCGSFDRNIFGDENGLLRILKDILKDREFEVEEKRVHSYLYLKGAK